VYGSGNFFATSDSTIAATSADGITWTQRTLPASGTWYGVAFGSGTFVALAYNSAIAATITLSGQSDFANVSGATSSTLSLTSLTNAADNLDRFRVVVSAANASSVTSQPATLTVS
jgi:sulfite exporter TauE/SafE